MSDLLTSRDCDAAAQRMPFNEKILISRCFLGENVKYNQTNNSLLDNVYIKKLYEQNIFIPICPEVDGGLSIPREASEINSYSKNLQVITKSKINVTKNFINGAYIALDLAKQFNVKIALLKSRSPSCSNYQIYDGTFSKKLINGNGICAKLLIENNIEVFNENELEIFLEKISYF